MSTCRVDCCIRMSCEAGHCAGSTCTLGFVKHMGQHRYSNRQMTAACVQPEGPAQTGRFVVRDSGPFAFHVSGCLVCGCLKLFLFVPTYCDVLWPGTILRRAFLWPRITQDSMWTGSFLLLNFCGPVHVRFTSGRNCGQESFAEYCIIAL